MAKAFRLAKQGELRLEMPDRVIVWAPRMPAGSPWRADLPSWYRPIHDPSIFLRELRAFVLEKRKHPTAVLTVDIETSGITRDSEIRIVNLHWRAGGQEWVAIIPLRWIDGSPIEPAPKFHLRCRTALKMILRESSRLAFQNGTFDTWHLLREGFLTDRKRLWLDTMLAHRASEWGEAPHNLGSILADQDEAVGDIEYYKGKLLHGAEKE